ncbi:MAG: hypothetical protein ACK4MI_06885 [Brevundimonas sp.]|uniref:hypothetical protein n=1 Tax=Brevundimonas sp. TaxID=1871086 RepID=UPI0028D1E330|nr:hypothetical protein [uncultured Brevundimonas sp.]
MRGARGFQQRSTAALAAAVVVLGALAAWVALRPTNAPSPEPADARVMRQIRVQAGAGAELRYSEPGQRRAVCGYVGRAPGGPAVGFVSIPNRILFSDDPLPTEFREMRRQYCPGFMAAPTPSHAVR